MSGDPSLPSGRRHTGPSGAPDRRVLGWFLAAWVGLTLAQLLAAFATQPPTRPEMWLVYVLASALIALPSVAATASVVLRVLAAVKDRWNRAGPLIRRVVAAAIVIVCAVPAAGLTTWGGLLLLDWWGSRKISCGDPAIVTVLTNADFRASIDAVAREFERTTADNGCPSVTVHVTEAARAQVSAALRAGWPNTALQAIGPRPDLWIGDRAVDLEAVAADQIPKVAEILKSPKVVAHSAVVLATAGAAGQPGPMSWRDMVERMRGLDRPVIRPEPSASAVGQLALLNDYPGDLPDPINTVDHAARLYETGYATSFSRAQWRRADVPTLLRDAKPSLCGPAAAPLRQAVLVLPAFLTTASAPTKTPLGADIAGCPAAQWPALTTFQTTGDRANVELAVVRLPWTTSLPADRFQKWLAGTSGQILLTSLGWESGAAGHGTDGQLARTALGRYQAARTTARVVLAVDTSKSMQSLQPEVTAVVTTLVDQFGPEDEVGLFGFVRPRGGRSVFPQGVDFGPARGTPVAGVGSRSRVVGVHSWLEHHSLADGDTPLAAALAQGTAVLSATSRPDFARDTLLIITDGHDLVDLPDWSQVAQRAAVTGQQVLVLTVGERSDLAVSSPTGDRVHVVSLAGDAPGQQVLRATSAVLWRAAG
jgi:hypothetical protein